jgi:ABC-type Mn2+/Zn2+ transport system permease subunit
VTRRLRLAGDTAIGLLFVAMLALGVAITSRSESFTGDLTRILFGELLGATEGKIGVQAVALAAVSATAVVCRRPFLMLSVDEGLARSAGFSARLFGALTLAMVAVSVVTGFQTVGTMLVLGMLVAPPATGALFARRAGSMTAIAAACGAVSCWLGLLVSYHLDIAAGASIVLVATGIFTIAAMAKEVARAGRHDDELPHAHGTVHLP